MRAGTFAKFLHLDPREEVVVQGHDPRTGERTLVTVTPEEFRELSEALGSWLSEAGRSGGEAG